MTSGGARDEAEELAFTQQDARLPWLEADDDFEEPGMPGGRKAALVIIAVLALAVIGGGGYWLLQQGPGTAVVADGSTIEAPKGPYKMKPADPGGTTALGTGDTSFAVAEGRRPANRVAGAENAALPSVEPEDGEAPAASGRERGPPERELRRPGRRLRQPRARRAGLADPRRPARSPAGGQSPRCPGDCRRQHGLPAPGGCRERRGSPRPVRRAEGERGRLPGQELKPSIEA